MTVTGMEVMVSRIYAWYTPDYLTLGICSLTEPAAAEKVMSFLDQIHIIVL